MKVYMATWLLERRQGDALTAAGNDRRLLSYYYLKDMEDELPRYVRTGRNPDPRKEGKEACGST